MTMHHTVRRQYINALDKTINTGHGFHLLQFVTQIAKEFIFIKSLVSRFS